MKLFGLMSHGTLMKIGMSDTPALFAEDDARRIAQNFGYTVVPVTVTP